MTAYRLKFHISSYWHCGSGRGGGSTVDAMVHRNRHNIPEIPGRTVKGLLRDATCRAEAWGHLQAGTTVRWFGTDSRNFEVDNIDELDDNDKRHIDRHQTEPGLLIFDNAVLENALVAWLSESSQKEACKELYRHLYATALDPQTGAANDTSLRGMEVVIPLDLFAPVSFRPGMEDSTDADDFKRQVGQVLPLIRGLGLARNRGLGRCEVTLQEVQS